MPTITDLITEWQLSMDTAPGRRIREPRDWRSSKHAYRLTIHRHDEDPEPPPLRVPFYCGPIDEPERPPDLPQVLDVLATEADLGRLSFRDFCDEMSVDELAPSSHAQWLQCYRLNQEMERLLGPDRLDMLLYDLER